MNPVERFIVVMYSRMWSKQGQERVVRTRFSDNGEHPTNIAATYATRGIPRSPSCLVLHFGGGSNLIRVENPFGLNYQRRPLHATNLYTTDARRAAGCKKGCKRQCKCRALNLQCTELCKCSRACGDNVQ